MPAIAARCPASRGTVIMFLTAPERPARHRAAAAARGQAGRIVSPARRATCSESIWDKDRSQPGGVQAARVAPTRRRSGAVPCIVKHGAFLGSISMMSDSGAPAAVNSCANSSRRVSAVAMMWLPPAFGRRCATAAGQDACRTRAQPGLVLGCRRRGAYSGEEPGAPSGGDMGGVLRRRPLCERGAGELGHQGGMAVTGVMRMLNAGRRAYGGRCPVGARLSARITKSSCRRAFRPPACP